MLFSDPRKANAASARPRFQAAPVWKRLGSGAVYVGASIALMFLILPLLALAWRAVEETAWADLPGSGIPNAIWLSFVSTGLTLLLATLFGTPLAYILARRRFAARRLVSVLVELPIVLPPAVAGLALLITFGRRGLVGAPLYETFGLQLPFSLAAVVMAQAFVAAPFYIRAAQVGFASVPPDLEEAARVDGAGGWRLFRHITLPLSGRALGAGLVLCWARALGEFGATILFAGSLQGRTQTMPLLIYNLIERDLDAAMLTGLLLVGLAAAALVVSRGLGRGSEL